MGSSFASGCSLASHPVSEIPVLDTLAGAARVCSRCSAVTEASTGLLVQGLCPRPSPARSAAQSAVAIGGLCGDITGAEELWRTDPRTSPCWGRNLTHRPVLVSAEVSSEEPQSRVAVPES